VDPVEAVRRCGGRASTAQLRQLGVRRRDVARALSAATLMRSRRGHYRLAELNDQLDVAISLTAVLSHRSAALHHGIPVATAPQLPEVIVRRNRRLSAAQQARASATWRDLRPGATRDGVTVPLQTVLDCARDLPFGEALSVADSALRSDLVTPEQLRQESALLRGPGSARARRVAAEARHLAANPFESCLRAIALDAGLDVVPQLQVTERGVFAMVDLADVGRRLVIEAESFEHHGTRRGFRKDVRRYTELVVFGWTVLRFTWEDVMLQPGYVRWALGSWRLARDGVLVGRPPPHRAGLA
jgi:very-short-patch-repair endonuclease